MIAFNSRETPTRGREMTVLEQLLGSIGNGSALPLDDVRTRPTAAKPADDPRAKVGGRPPVAQFRTP